MGTEEEAAVDALLLALKKKAGKKGKGKVAKCTTEDGADGYYNKDKECVVKAAPEEEAPVEEAAAEELAMKKKGKVAKCTTAEGADGYYNKDKECVAKDTSAEAAPIEAEE